MPLHSFPLHQPATIQDLAAARRRRLYELADQACIRSTCSDETPCPPCKALDGVVLDALARRGRA